MMTQPTGAEGQQGQEGQAGQGSEGGDGFKPIQSQDELNKVVGDRIARERAKFADYEDLKSKASQFDALADASKTETDRLTERLAALETAKSQADAEALRFRIAQAQGVDAEDMDLLVGNDAETLTANAKRIAALRGASKKNGNHVAREGTSAAPGPGAPRDQFAALIRGQLNTE